MNPTFWVLVSLTFGTLLGGCAPGDEVIGASVGIEGFNSAATRSPDGGGLAPGAGGAASTVDPPAVDEPARGAMGSTTAITPDPASRDAGAPSAQGSRQDAGAAAPDAMPAVAATAACHMTFQVTTVSFGGEFAPKNVGAIWVVDSAKKFVKSLKVWAAAERGMLGTWISVSKQNRVDAVTGATASSHGVRSATWNCTNVTGQPVAPGLYRVYAEFTESNGAGKVGSWDFTVGGADPVSLMPADTGSFKGIRLQLMP